MKQLVLFLPFLLLAGCVGTSTGIAAQQGDAVKVDYVGSLENGEVFDTSLQEAAQNAGLPARPSYEPLAFTVGGGQMIPGFEQGVMGMRVGEEKTITIPPQEAYGQSDPSLIVEVPLENIASQGVEIRPGDVIEGEQAAGRVLELRNSTALVDFNHQLAGKTLVFRIILRDIQRQ
ncbi:peptidylprolyl isomerase [Candidatus Micrarchaeota archaeon]|nr:peptidylprolyl isomerase [Candidatus Micrarchaeota archaeon]